MEIHVRECILTEYSLHIYKTYVFSGRIFYVNMGSSTRLSIKCIFATDLFICASSNDKNVVIRCNVVTGALPINYDRWNALKFGGQ